MVDLSFYKKQRPSLEDYRQQNVGINRQRAQKDIAMQQKEEQFNQEQALNALKMQQAQYDLSNPALDINKLGQGAFIKKSMKQQLTPQEEAAFKYLDVKSGGMTFDPATGVAIQKPTLSSALGGQQPQQMQQIPIGGQPQQLQAPFSGQIEKPQTPVSNLEQRYQLAMQKAQGNPKLQQNIQQQYSKQLVSPSDAQTLAGGFAKRVEATESVFTNPDIIKAGMSIGQAGLSGTPLIGNILASNEYQQFDQASRDFINAVLRRESGAAIAESEFDNAYKQYLPRVGDGKAVLAQKKKNREKALNSLELSAGGTFTKTTQTSKLGKKQVGEIGFNLRKAGYSDAQVKEYMKLKGY